MKTLWLSAMLVLAAALLWGQQGATSRKNTAGPAEPQIGYAAQDQTHNVLIGCVSGSANHPLLVQQQEHRTYRLQGNTSAVKDDIGKLVQVTGRLMPGTGPSVSGGSAGAPAFQVQSAQRLGESCQYLAAPGQPPNPATGKTGSQGDAMNTTSTASAGQVTPGIETAAGQAQAPGSHTGLNTGGVPPPKNQTATQGAPPTWEQAAQNPADAERIAQGAQRAELDNAQHQLGVNAQPNYSQNDQQQSEAAGASEQEKRAATTQNRQQQPAAEPQTHPTLVGCLTQSADGHQFLLTEKSGTRHHLQGPTDLKGHINHLVEVVGKPSQKEANRNSVAGGSEPGFEVSGIQDLAPTCGATRH